MPIVVLRALYHRRAPVGRLMGCDARRAVVDRQAIDAEVSLVSKVGAPHYGYVRPAEQIEMVAREASSLAAQFVGRDHQRQFGNGQRGNRERHRVVRITTDVGVDDDRCGRERRRAGRGRTSNFHRAVEAGELVMALAQADRRPPGQTPSHGAGVRPASRRRLCSASGSRWVSGLSPALYPQLPVCVCAVWLSGTG